MLVGNLIPSWYYREKQGWAGLGVSGWSRGIAGYWDGGQEQQLLFNFYFEDSVVFFRECYSAEAQYCNYVAQKTMQLRSSIFSVL